MTLAELRDELRVTVALSTLWAAVRSLGYTFKKSHPGGRAGPAGRAGGPRRLAAGGRPSPRPDPVVFVDETAAGTTTDRRYGYAPAGSRSSDRSPTGTTSPSPSPPPCGPTA